MAGSLANLASAVTLSNGVMMPRFGLGTFKAKGAEVRNAVVAARASGVIHIDTATIYKNEQDIAAALATCPGGRDAVFITSKISPYDAGYDKTLAATAEILERLQTDHVDCLLIHWPGAAKTEPSSPKNKAARLDSWRALELLHKKGAAKSIGVSNFTVAHLTELVEACTVRPAVNQFELHPKLQQRELVKKCEELGVVVEAYSPLGAGELVKDPLVKAIATKIGKTPAQVLIRWSLQKGCVCIPKSVKPDRVKSNADVFDFELGPEEMAALDGMEDGTRYCWDPTEIA